MKEGRNKVIVLVGEIEHPMTEEHFIEWIAIETNKGIQKVNLIFNDKPKAEFLVDENDYVNNAYVYCNLHGFWKSFD